MVKEVDFRFIYGITGKNQNDYYYHYTDAESALSILSDGVIYPYKLKTKLYGYGLKQELKKYVYLLSYNPTFSDIRITEEMYNYPELDDNDFNSNFHKLEYAFGFKKDEFKTGKLIKIRSNFLWKHNGEIKLNEHDFILVKKFFYYV